MLPEIHPGAAVTVRWSAERYHADCETTSRGNLVDLLRNPARYYAAVESGVRDPDPPTVGMVFGTYAHLAVLEWPEFERRAIKQVGPDSIMVKQDTLDQLLGLRRSVLEHPMIAALLTNPTVVEQTILWRPDGLSYTLDDDPIRDGDEVLDGDLVIRVRPDAITVIDDDDGPLVFVSDLKTTADCSPEEFAKSCARYRYHLQAALYRDAVAALFGTDNVRFMFWAVAKTHPFEVACYDLDDDALELGRNQYRAAMIELLKRRHTGDWTARWQRSIHTLSLPRWAYYDDNR